MRAFTCRMFIGTVAVAAALAFAPVAAWADAASEVVTAGTHASLAAGSADIAGVHTHLHHALNCLVGPKGNGFDAKDLNPGAQNGNAGIRCHEGTLWHRGGRLQGCAEGCRRSRVDAEACEVGTRFTAYRVCTLRRRQPPLPAQGRTS
jgi:hypothetical protein